MDYKMELTPEQLAMLNGEQGETMAKVVKTLVMYGEEMLIKEHKYKAKRID